MVESFCRCNTIKKASIIVNFWSNLPPDAFANLFHVHFKNLVAFNLAFWKVPKQAPYFSDTKIHFLKQNSEYECPPPISMDTRIRLLDYAKYTIRPLDLGTMNSLFSLDQIPGKSFCLKFLHISDTKMMQCSVSYSQKL